MKKSGNIGKIVLVVLVVAVIAAALFLVYRFAAPKAAPGSKNIAITVVHGDATEQKFQFTTQRETLADALLEQKIVEDNQGPYGLYILTADGETADEKKQEWWCITKGGQAHMLGAGETPLADGERYELTFTVGYDMAETT